MCCVALVVLAGSVAGTDDHVVLVDDDVDFSTLRTFEIRDVRTTSRHPAIDSQIVRNVLRDAVQASLVARGFKAAPKAALVVESSVRGVDASAVAAALPKHVAKLLSRFSGMP